MQAAQQQRGVVERTFLYNSTALPFVIAPDVVPPRETTDEQLFDPRRERPMTEGRAGAFVSVCTFQIVGEPATEYPGSGGGSPNGAIGRVVRETAAARGSARGV